MSRRKRSKREHVEGEPKFRSEFERWVWSTATKYKNKIEFEPYYLPYVIKGSYLPDFVLANGIVVEAKGRLTAADCRKMRSVKASHPELDIRFVFQNANNRMNKRSKMRYWEWAEKHNFGWAEGSIPPDWFKESKK